MNLLAIGFLIVALQDQPPAPAAAATETAPAGPGFEIVELGPAAKGRGKSHSVTRTRTVSGGKPIKIKSQTHKGIPKFKKPKGH
jgi:hypothetical protein